jgi:hypothetical protein
MPHVRTALNSMDFSNFNKTRSASFNDQKALLKRLLQGKTCLCPSCKKPLTATLNAKTKLGMVKCQQGCTDIELELGA